MTEVRLEDTSASDATAFADFSPFTVAGLSLEDNEPALAVRFSFEKASEAAPSGRPRFDWSPLGIEAGADASLSTPLPLPLGVYPPTRPPFCAPPRAAPRPPRRAPAAFGRGVLKMTFGVMAIFTHSFLPLGLPAELSLRSFSVLSCDFFRSSSRAVSGVGHDSWSRFGGSGKEAGAETVSFSC
jgi:hypothetical protein